MKREPITTQSRKEDSITSERKRRKVSILIVFEQITLSFSLFLSFSSLSNFLSICFPSYSISIERLSCWKFQCWQFLNEIHWTRNVARHPINQRARECTFTKSYRSMGVTTNVTAWLLSFKGSPTTESHHRCG